LIEGFVCTGKPGPLPDWLDDPKRIDPYYVPFSLVLAGQYDAALDWTERQSGSTLPQVGVFWLRSALYRERMGDMPHYRELVERLATFQDDTE
jgi:hypothetical protein